MSTDRYYELTEALSALTFQVPFVSSLLYDNMTIHTVDTLPSGHPNPTLATNGSQIFINKDYFCNELVTDYRMAAIAHEVLHSMFFHPPKMLQYGREGLGGKPFDHIRFNVAADLIINAMLKRCKLGVLHPDWLWSKLVTADDRVEDIYARLEPPLPPPMPPASGESGESGEPGEGQGDTTIDSPPEGGSGDDPGNDDADKWTLTAADGIKQEKLNAPAAGSQDTHVPAPPQKSEIEWKTAAKAAALGAKAMGKLHGELARAVDDYVEPKINWMEVLRDSIVARAGFDSINWRRTNKRKMRESGVCYPTRNSWDIPLVAIIEDSSGSISHDELATFRGALIEILTQVKPRETQLLSVDMRVTEEKLVIDVEEIDGWTSQGGGGTDMEAGFRWLTDNNMEPDVVIVLTDGHTKFTKEPEFPVTWVTTDRKAPDFTYGTVVEMEVEK